MVTYRFVIRDRAMARVTAAAFFPAEDFTDVEVTFGEVAQSGTYTVTFSSESQTSLDQATFAFRTMASAQRAIVSEGQVS